ncbi:diguanylate cyclase [uncultured Erythrobacter sp.]|uniref:sensor domain-containing diguanylate cyclase n=1 Tax=uncultured Erythrobacter sp. TaxID=263913 RepID=UPI00262E2B86|nr:diguanylate cyclase [uncultured Erythrobacter sp.]
MHWGRLSILLAIASAILAFATPPALAAAGQDRPASIAPSGHAATGLDVSFEEMARPLGPGAGGPLDQSSSWRCDNQFWRADYPASWILFDAASWEGQSPPRFFFSRIAQFNAITFATVDADGSIRTARFAQSKARAFAAGPVFQLPLPRVTSETQALMVRVERAHIVPLLTEARLTQESDAADWSELEVAFLAFVVGMLVLPLIIDITFYAVLRERYVIFHAIIVTAMIGFVLFAGGLISLIVALPVGLLAVAAPLCWTTGCGFTALFLAEFLEKKRQSLLMQQLTRAAGIWTLFVPAFFALQLEATQSFDIHAYYVTVVPVVAFITFATFRATWRGSVLARYIAIGWTAITLASVERMMRGIGLYIGPSNLDQLLYLAAGVHVVMMSLAIAQRFVAIRSQRDVALREARVLETLSERDPLTGLMNRRVMEERFAALRQQGFDTFAVIDLDHFKQINDRFGHQVGDQALIACANAIRGDEERDLLAVRLGGEEFVMLLRGPDAYDRAEALRQSIPMRIAHEVEGLNQPVTASMGLIELPRSSHHILSFAELYSRADQLLYNAKSLGRNRTCFERLTVFKKAPPKRGQTKTAA